MEKPKSRYGAVRIPKKLLQTLKEFVSTEEAEKMGFLHVSDVVSAAVRDYLLQLNFFKNSEKKCKATSQVEA